ncbi:MAG: DoxX family protein [Pseudomonadota bacterium]
MSTTLIILVIGRALVASLFFLGGVNKVFSYSETLLDMNAAGLEPSALLLPLTIIFEVGGGLAVMCGGRPAIAAAPLLAAFTLATNVFFHQFWAFDGPMAQIELSLFFKNVSIAGALLYIAAASKMADQPK